MIYYLNLTKQQHENNFIGYQRLFSAIESYNMKDLSPKSWIDLVNRMLTNNTIFELYCSHMAPPQYSCNKNSILCDIDEIYC